MVIASQLEATRQEALLAQQDSKSRPERLQKPTEPKNAFFSMASHELKTPITLILTEVQFRLRQLTKQKEVSPEAAACRELLEQVNQQTRYLQRLITNILDLSILGAAKQMPLRIARYDLNALCREIIGVLGASSGRSIILQAPPTPLMLDTDRERIGQVISNLSPMPSSIRCK